MVQRGDQTLTLDVPRQPAPKVITQTSGSLAYLRKEGKLMPFKTTTGGLAEWIPLVMLIGSHTYLVPETMAASIADRQRGVRYLSSRLT